MEKKKKKNRIEIMVRKSGGELKGELINYSWKMFSSAGFARHEIRLDVSSELEQKQFRAM